MRARARPMLELNIMYMETHSDRRPRYRIDLIR